jgi:EpsI family protein
MSAGWETSHLPTPYTINWTATGPGQASVQLQVVMFAKQKQGEEAISPMNRVTAEGVRYVSQGQRLVQLGDEVFEVVQEKAVVYRDGLDREFLVQRWYRVAGHSLSNRYEGKAREAIARIWPGRADGAWLAISTPLEVGRPDVSEQVLKDFAEQVMPSVYRKMDTMLGWNDPGR